MSMNEETYVRMVGGHRLKGYPVTYCPIQKETGAIVMGLSLIGFYPKNAKVVGKYNEDTDTLTIFKKYQSSVNQKATENE